MSDTPKPDPQMLRMIASAKAAGLENFKVSKLGKKYEIEVFSEKHANDDIQDRIERMKAGG